MSFIFRTLLGPLALALSLSALSATAQANNDGADHDDGADAEQSTSAPSQQGVINLNTASEEELLRLPGIGPSKARAILELRTKLSSFKRVEDLMRVKGIGRKTFRKLLPMLKLAGPTTLVEARAQRGAAR